MCFYCLHSQKHKMWMNFIHITKNIENAVLKTIEWNLGSPSICFDCFPTIKIGSNCFMSWFMKNPETSRVQIYCSSNPLFCFGFQSMFQILKYKFRNTSTNKKIRSFSIETASKRRLSTIKFDVTSERSVGIFSEFFNFLTLW